MHYDWPGNVRELENVVQRALIYSHGEDIQPDDIQFEDGLVEDSHEFDEVEKVAEGSLNDELRNREYQTIIDALKMEMGNRKAVAERLGISQRTLRYKLAKMRDHGITIPGR